MNISQLYIKDTYLNKNIDIFINKPIIEYDLKSANTSLCKEYKLLPKSAISEIESMSKKDRVVTIGKLMRKDKIFKEGLKSAFVDIRERFFNANKIADEDILSIKKDAIFCLRRMNTTNFGECKFVIKNKYSSYMYVDRLEMYYTSNSIFPENSILDIKGIDDLVLSKHNDYMIKFIKTIFNHLEGSSQATQYSYIKSFIDKYKNGQLEVGYYREFNNESIIRMVDSDETYDDEIFIPYDHKQEHVNIDYNFFNIILPILKKII